MNGRTFIASLKHYYKSIIRLFDSPISRRKYFIAPVIIGIATGILALLFVHLLNLFNRLFLESIVGYYAPHALVALVDQRLITQTHPSILCCCPFAWGWRGSYQD